MRIECSGTRRMIEHGEVAAGMQRGRAHKTLDALRVLDDLLYGNADYSTWQKLRETRLLCQLLRWNRLDLSGVFSLGGAKLHLAAIDRRARTR